MYVIGQFGDLLFYNKHVHPIKFFKILSTTTQKKNYHTIPIDLELSELFGTLLYYTIVTELVSVF